MSNALASDEPWTPRSGTRPSPTSIQLAPIADCAPQHCDVTQHVCVDGLLSSDCSGATPNCSTGHTCGAAYNNSNTCPTDTPVCETSAHTCVEWLGNADCDPTASARLIEPVAEATTGARQFVIAGDGLPV